MFNYMSTNHNYMSTNTTIIKLTFEFKYQLEGKCSLKFLNKIESKIPSQYFWVEVFNFEIQTAGQTD